MYYKTSPVPTKTAQNDNITYPSKKTEQSLIDPFVEASTKIETDDKNGEQPGAYTDKKEVAISRNEILVKVHVCQSTYHQGN